jgi:sensor histidine kinase YesM
MVFNISNSQVGKGTTKNGHGGIGLTNLEERLKLLYPGKYNFDLTKDDNKFEIMLEIDLNGS